MRGEVKLSRLCCFHMMSWWPHWCTKTMKGDHVGDHYVCGIDLFFSAKRLVSFFSKEVDYLYLLSTTKLICLVPFDKYHKYNANQCMEPYITLHLVFHWCAWCCVLNTVAEQNLRLTLEVPMVTKINFLVTISIDCQEIRLWELIEWSSKRKCFDLLSNSQHLLKGNI